VKRFLPFQLLLSTLFCATAFAHGDLDERILKVSEEIEIKSDSAFLYFKRGKLFYQHNEPNKSISDFNTSMRLGHSSDEQNLLFAKNYLKLEDYFNAKLYSNKILMIEPLNVNALQVKAHAFFGMGNFKESALLFEKVINNVNQSLPKNYINASTSWESLNNEEGFEKSKQVIYRGINELGDLVSFYDRIIEIALNQKDYELAITTQKKVVDLANRKENAYYKLSELYLQNNEGTLALESLNLADDYFKKLPLRIQNTGSMKELSEKINSNKKLLLEN